MSGMHVSPTVAMLVGYQEAALKAARMRSVEKPNDRRLRLIGERIGALEAFYAPAIARAASYPSLTSILNDGERA